MKKILLAAVAAVAMSGAAIAADLPTKGAPVYRAAPMFSWTGFYVGLHGGYGRADADLQNQIVPGTFDLGQKPDGYFFGAQAGYNWQVAPNWVWGVEVDYAGASLNSHGFVGPFAATFNTEVKSMASARVRGGYAWDRNLLYVTGGWGWARANTDTANGGGALSNNSSFSGWVLGAGYEAAIANNWSVKVEYLYYSLGNDNVNFTPLFGGAGLWNVDGNIQTVKAGVNYRFGTY